MDCKLVSNIIIISAAFYVHLFANILFKLRIPGFPTVWYILVHKVHREFIGQFILKISVCSPDCKFVLT